MTGTKLSREAFARLEAELEDLTTRGRVEVAHRIEAARSLGDLSENGDYHAAKDDQGKMEARIRHLQATLKDAEIVEAQDVPTDVVAVGTTVTVRDQFGEDTFLVGSIEEKREGVEVISPTSPLGEALLGKRAGDAVEYEVHGKPQRAEIIKIGS